MKILVIEDDADIASNIGQYFEDKSHELDFAFNGAHGLALATAERFDLIILDLMLPGKDGITVCREFREQTRHDTPILMLTARDTLDDKISGFEAGADDYLVKPFSLRELEVRVLALTRRGQGKLQSTVIVIDNLELNQDTMQVSRASQPIKLKPKAFRILAYLMQHADRVISRQELSRIKPDERGIQLSDHFEDDEVGKIAQAFDSYTRKMDSYVEKQIAFAAMASHELRSPLTIVQTSADLIASRYDNPDIIPHLDKIQRASANMANMIHALLAVTRDQPTKNVLQSIALQPLVDEILETMSPEICAKQINIDNRLTPDISIDADRTLITVVLTNLIRNGVKHGQQSSIEIDMQAPVLSITDNGIGIDSQDLQHIFDFRFRGQHSQGYGVGLYISKLICDYQGWSLDLASNPQGGIIARINFAS